MAVKENTERDAVQITYDKSLTDSEIVYARFSRGHGDGPGDVSTGDAHVNSGFDVATYPKGSTGITTLVEMIDEDGEVFDSGELTR